MGTLTRLKLPQWSSLWFGAAVCLRLPPHTTSRRKLSRLATDQSTCSCLRLTVATNSPRKGLSPPIQCPCRAHPCAPWGSTTGFPVTVRCLKNTEKQTEGVRPYETQDCDHRRPGADHERRRSAGGSGSARFHPARRHQPDRSGALGGDFGSLRPADAPAGNGQHGRLHPAGQQWRTGIRNFKRRAVEARSNRHRHVGRPQKRKTSRWWPR